MNEKKEGWMRIVVGVISGILLWFWSMLIKFVVIINWLITIFSGKRHKGMADFCEIWNTQAYVFLRYMTFVTNERPFPFSDLEKSISKFKK